MATTSFKPRVAKADPAPQAEPASVDNGGLTRVSEETTDSKQSQSVRTAHRLS